MTPERSTVLDKLAELILAVERPHPVRVAIDGVSAAGKTTLADELTLRIETAGRPVIRASIDDFHNPRSVRYARGPLSPEGYYFDTNHHDAFRQNLLLPLGPGGTLRYPRSSSIRSTTTRRESRSMNPSRRPRRTQCCYAIASSRFVPSSTIAGTFALS